MKNPQKQSPPPQGNRRDIPPDAHHRASIVARALMQIPAKPSK